MRRSETAATNKKLFFVLRGAIKFGRTVNQDRRFERDQQQPNYAAENAANRQSIQNKPASKA